MAEKTEKNLAHAFAAESRASARNVAFAMKAKKEELHQLARLFRAVSNAEAVHANRFLLLMRGKVGSSEENLKTSFENEIRANLEEYPKLINDATDEGEKGALKAFSQALKVEKQHEALFKAAMKDMLADESTDYFVCQICGFIKKDTAPDNCPVCNAIQSRFNKID